MKELRMKRVYDPAEKKDGYRILVDRLWPRGIKKEELPYDVWAKNIAPSTEIRKAFNHDPQKFDQFKKDYLFELNENSEADELLERVVKELEHHNVTLLYSAKNTEMNNVVVLKEWLEKFI